MKKLKDAELQKRIELFNKIVNGEKGKRLAFSYEEVLVQSRERRCSACLEPGATWVEKINLDPEYKRFLCDKCKQKEAR